MGLAPRFQLRRHAAAPHRADERGEPDAAVADDAVSSVPVVRAGLRARLQVEQFGLDQVALAIEGCTACERSKVRHRAMSGSGAFDAAVMVIDEVPSIEASGLDQYLDPESDRLLEQILFAVGLRRAQVYLSHVVRCDGAPVTSVQSELCSSYLQRELELISPRAVLALGAAARTSLERLGKWSTTHCFQIEHPKRMLGDAMSKREAWHQLASLRRLLASPSLGITP
jgi:DNA polymerase